MASSDDERPGTEPKVRDEAQPSKPSSPSQTEVSTPEKKRGRPRKVQSGALGITSVDAFKPAPSHHSLTKLSLLKQQEKLKEQVHKARLQEKAAPRRQNRLKSKAQHLSNADLIEIIQQRRQLQEAASKKKRLTEEKEAEQSGAKHSKKERTEKR